jgi:hypothetical protein
MHDAQFAPYTQNSRAAAAPAQPHTQVPYPEQRKGDYIFNPQFAPYNQNSRAAAAPSAPTQPRSRGPEASKKLKTSSGTDQATVFSRRDFFYDQFKEEFSQELTRDFYKMLTGQYERAPGSWQSQEEYYYGDVVRDRGQGPYGREDMGGDSGDGSSGYDIGILYQGAVCWR